MPIEVVSWVFPGATFLIVVLGSVVWAFMRSEVTDIKTKNENKVDLSRFQALEARIDKEMTDMRDETKNMIRDTKQASEKDVELVRADVREQMSQMRERIDRMESNILLQMKMLFTANKE